MNIPKLCFSYISVLESIFVIIVLLFIGIEDAKRHIISNRNLRFLFWGAILFYLLNLDKGLLLTNRIVGMISMSLPMLLINAKYKKAFGMGDVKLVAISGFILGYERNIYAIGIGFILAGIYSVYLVVAKGIGRQGKFGIGGFICTGIVIQLLLRKYR